MTGISTFIVQWTSKASADQRAGRAGRTSAGHCYRLYSSAVFNDEFKKYSEPEIVSKPIDDFLLQMKAIGITNIMNYPFPTAPNIESLMAAENRLVMLSALKKSTVCGKNGKPVTVTEVTPLGKTLSYFPTSPRYSKILAQAHISKIIPHAVAIIAGLTVQEIFSNQENCKRVDRKLFYSNPYTLVLGDLMVLLVAIATSNEEGLSAMFCDKVGLRYNAMEEINKLRSQLLHYVNKIYGANYTMDIPLPTEKQIKLLRLTFLCGFGDHVAKRVPFEYDGDDPEAAKRRPLRNCYQSIEVEKQVFISPQSALYNETPEYVVYQEIYESSEHSQSGRLYMRNIFVIDCEWLPKCVKELCNLSNPLEEPPPRFDHKSGKVKCHCASTFGPYNWKISPVEVEYPDGSDKYRHFAYHLLNGDIIKSLSQHCGHLLMQPKMFVKPWAYIKPQVDKVVKCLANNEISTRQALIDKWKTDSKCKQNIVYAGH